MSPPVNKARWLGAYAVGLLADQAYYLSLAWYAAALSPDPMVVGLVTGIGSLPRAVLLLPGGALADRLGTKRVATAASALKGLALLGAALWAAWSGAVDAAFLAAVAVLVGSLDAAFLPAIQSMPWAVAEAGDVPLVQKQFSVVQRCGVVLGPALAGVLLAGWPMAAVYGALATCFALSAAALGAVRARETTAPADRASGGGVLAALAGLARKPAALAMLALVAASELICSGAFSTGVALLVDAHGWGADAMGLLVTVYGAGSVAGAVASLLWRPQIHLGAVAGVCLTLMGAMLMAVAVAPAPGWAAAAIALAGLGAGAVSTFLTASYLGSVRAEEGARSMAVLSLASFGTASVSSLLCGAVAQAWGAAAIFSTFGVGLVAIAFWAALCRPLRISI